MQQGSVGHSWADLVGRWARRTNCHTLVLHDPYLAAARHSTEWGPMAACLDDEALGALVATMGLVASTNLGLFHEVLVEVLASSTQLRRVRLHVRGQLRPGCPAGDLLEDWARRLHEQLRGRGIDFELVQNVRLHVRRVVVQGIDKAVEVNIEWGLNVFLDARANRDLSCEMRQRQPAVRQA